MFYIVFLVITLAGVAYAVLAPEEYSYVSLIKLAEDGAGKYIDKPDAVIASLENRWVPEFKAEYAAKHEHNLPFNVAFENPKNTGLIRIATDTSPDEQKTVQQFHRQLLSQLETRQSASVSRLKRGLEKRIENLNSTVGMLKGLPDAGAALASAIDQRVSLEAELETIEPTEVLVVARESATRKGPRRSLIMVLAGVLGLMVGVFSTFIAEFISAVKLQMYEP